jgi:hypothetical protein
MSELKYAFPSAFISEAGMTLRDYFAAASLPAIYAEYMASIRNHECNYAEEWRLGLAFSAYDMADAMIKARKK